MTDASYVLTFSCPNRPGIVAAVSTYLFERGCNILDAQQYDDTDANVFFMRVVFDAQRGGFGVDIDLAQMRATFESVASSFSMSWVMRDRREKRRVLILVSKFDHCLADLLYRWRIGELHMDVVGVLANHPKESYDRIDFGGLPFFHLPVTRETKLEQEQSVWKVISETRADVVVLARYMQVLSDGLSAKLVGRCINIHHSFLPGFKGANPYTQAYERGVKLIGATAHYVTSQLDEGPIIEQDVGRISHRDRPEDLVRKGRDIERRVLARALRHHLEDRVVLNGKKTVVFPD